MKLATFNIFYLIVSFVLWISTILMRFKYLMSFLRESNNFHKFAECLDKVNMTAFWEINKIWWIVCLLIVGKKTFIAGIRMLLWRCHNLWLIGLIGYAFSSFFFSLIYLLLLLLLLFYFYFYFCINKLINNLFIISD